MSECSKTQRRDCCPVLQTRHTSPDCSNSENRCEAAILSKSRGRNASDTSSIGRLFNVLEAVEHIGLLREMRRGRAMNQGIDEIFCARPRTEPCRRVDVPGIRSEERRVGKE